MAGRKARRWLVGCLTVLAACGGDGPSAPLPVASVQVTPPSTSISPGQTAQLTAATLDGQQRTLSNRIVTWRSTDEAVARVTNTGLVTAIVVGGPVTIIATSEGQDGSASITVVPPPVATVSVAPASPSLTPGAAVQLTTTLRDASGATLTGRVVTWASSNNGVATVSSAGLVTGVAVGGPVTITATSEGQSGTATVSVVAPVVTTVAVAPTAASVSTGGTTPLAATVRDQNNIILTGRVVTWSTSNAAIATVSPAGVVTGVSAGGPVTVTATSEGKSGTASVTVTTSPCDASSSIAIGQSLNGALATTDCVLDDGSYMDQYQLPAITATGRIQFDVTSTAFDAYLILFLRNPDGSKVAVGADNNSGGGTNARITRDVVAGETYVIGANSLLSGITGAYQVSVQQVMFVAGAARKLAGPNDDEQLAAAKMAMAAKALRQR